MSGPIQYRDVLRLCLPKSQRFTYLRCFTDNFERRLAQHQAGKVISTKHRLPFQVLFAEEYKTIKEARKRELYYKSEQEEESSKNFSKDFSEGF